MSEIVYPRKSKLSFNKATLSHGNRETKDQNKYMKRTGNSWQTLTNFKTLNNFRKMSNIIEKKSDNNILSQINKDKTKNVEIIPIKQHNFFKIKFNKAPTLKQNQKEINNIIKKNKLKRIKELRNIYNNILINESKIFRNSLYVTGSGFFSKKNSSIRRNRSGDQSTINNNNIQYKLINEINHPSEINTSLFNKTGFNYYLSKNSFDKEAKTINKSLIFQEIKLKKSNSQNLLPMLSNNKTNNIKLSNKTLSKARTLVNDVIFNELNSVKEFSKKENNMIKFRIAQNIQCKEIKNMEINDEFNINNKLNKLKEIKNILDNNYAIYSYDMNNYIYFVKDKLSEIKDNLKILDKEIFNENIYIEKLVLKIVKKQEELEHLIEIRNFLQLVKDNYEKNEREQNYYFELLIKDSNKFFIGNYFLNLKIINQITNKSLAAFMSSFLELKEKINDERISIYECEPNLLNSLYNKKDKIKPIFESVDEFIKVYNYHMDKNMIYLETLESIKKVINRLKAQYDYIYANDNNNIIEEEIVEKMEMREQLIKTNEILKKRNIYYKDHIKKRRTQIEINNHKKIKNKPTYLDIDIDLDLIHRENYNLQLKTIKYNGILLLQKIIFIVKNFFKLNYAKDDFYVKRDILNLLELKIDEFNDENIQLIYEYILKLISIYEDICKYILCNHKKYLSDKNNEEFITKKAEEINVAEKLKKSREQRKMKIIKKNEEQQKIIEKCYKPIVYIENKMVTDTKIKRRKILKIKDEQKLEDEEKNFAENEFINLTKYHEDII